LKAFKGHPHAPKFLPGDLSTIDNEERHLAVKITVRIDPTSHDRIFPDVHFKLAAPELLDG